MKKLILLNLVAATALLASAYIQKKSDPCNPAELRKKIKTTMDPFKYDSSKLTRINFTKRPQKLSTEVPLSLFGKYRLVFNTEGLPQKIGINVYNRDVDAKKRELLFSNADSAETDKVLVFNPKKHTTKVFVDYEIPPDSLNKKMKGCIYVALGYD
jgi:hypothetical protein